MPTIDKWSICLLHIRALKQESWIEAISLGYTLLEMELRYLLKSTTCPNRTPLPDSEIERCRYLLDLATLARDKGFLPQLLHDQVVDFNRARIKAIHKLLTETVTMEELAAAAQATAHISHDISFLWLPYTIGPEEIDNG